MADAFTTLLSLNKPEVTGSDDTWGDKLNDDFEAIDDVLSDRGGGGLVTAGSGTAYTVTPNYDYPALVDGLIFRAKAHASNTSSFTINFNGLGAMPVAKRVAGSPISMQEGDYPAGHWGEFFYSTSSGDQWFMTNPATVVLRSQANTFTQAQTIERDNDEETFIRLICTTSGSARGPGLKLLRDNTPNNDNKIGFVYFSGHNSTDTEEIYTSLQAIIHNKQQNAEEGRLDICTARGDGLGSNARVHIAKGMWMEGANGGDKGDGNFNAEHVYDDSVLLTCAGTQQEFIDNLTVDMAKWNGIAPRGIHEAAQHLSNMVRGGFDPRRAENYFVQLQADQALPGMPTMQEWQHNTMSVGHMHNRLWLAVEMLALTVKDLTERLAVLEGK